MCKTVRVISSCPEINTLSRSTLVSCIARALELLSLPVKLPTQCHLIIMSSVRVVGKGQLNRHFARQSTLATGIDVGCETRPHLIISGPDSLNMSLCVVVGGSSRIQSHNQPRHNIIIINITSHHHQLTCPPYLVTLWVEGVCACEFPRIE